MDSPDRWRKLEQIFHEALERPESERESWLDSSCGADTSLRAEVKSLLDSDQAAGGAFVGSKVERAVIELNAEIEPKAAGRRLGPYRLIRELGRGGMGAVYLAARDDRQYESEVAVKLVRPGLDTDFILRRFRRERQILANLQHPNIARLFDGGTTEDGTPYLVMEYIQGSWITRYAAQKGLSVEERLRLFLPVCSAVEHAHLHFIVHRDIKPGNILIDQSGAPKLLDFGVCKLLRASGGASAAAPAKENDTAEMPGASMMTPDYASPEQILGDPVTVVSDVYSLGVVLYELLSGTRPHHIEECTPLALERAICLQETVSPSRAVGNNRALAWRLKGDLDHIILRAMQREPDRRYHSVAELAQDIGRHLDHRPVTARPDSLAYRASKFWRRNRVAVTVGGLIAAGLVGGATMASREARIARERFQDVRTLATSVLFDVEEGARKLPGSRPVSELITRAEMEYLGNLSRNSDSDWALKRELATAYMRLAELQGGAITPNLGDDAGTLQSLQHAGLLLDAVLKHSTDRKAALDRMTVAQRLAAVHRRMGHFPLAIEANEDGLRRAEAILATTPRNAEVTQYAILFRLDLALLLQQSGELVRAAKEIAGGIRLLQQVSAATPDDRDALYNLAVAQAQLGAIESDLGNRQEALDSYRTGVWDFEETLRRFPDNLETRHQLMLAYGHVGDTLGNPLYDNFGDEAGARAAYARMVTIASGLYEAQRDDARAMSDYGIALLRQGLLEPLKEKRRLLEQAHSWLERAAMRNPNDRATATHKAWTETELGDVALAGGDKGSAVRQYRLAIATSEAAQPIDLRDDSSQRWLFIPARKLAEEQVRMGDRAGALDTLDKVLHLAERVDAGAPAKSVTIRSGLARAWQGAGSVYSMLIGGEQGELRKKDRETGVGYYRRSIAEWKKLEPLPGFTALRRTEMELATAELTRLNALDGGVR